MGTAGLKPMSPPRDTAPDRRPKAPGGDALKVVAIVLTVVVVAALVLGITCYALAFG